MCAAIAPHERRNFGLDFFLFASAVLLTAIRGRGTAILSPRDSRATQTRVA